MLLTIDVGNTHTCIGAFEGDELRYEWRIASERQKTEDEIGLTVLHFLDQVGVKTTDIEGIVFGSVVPVL
ncbi:MAG: type III pantothenate kinase, partial [Firmicutes bacterium]|nr:type III pantothenate kinase [Bacillota bacterium]